MGTIRIMRFGPALARGLALLGATPLIVLGLLTAEPEVRNFFDPCFFFLDTPGGNPLPAGCHQGSGTTERKAGVVSRLVLVQGTALAAAVAGLIGVFRSRSRLVLGVSFGLFALTLPLMMDGTGLVTLFSGLSFLASFFVL